VFSSTILSTRLLAASGIAFVHAPTKTFWGYGAELKDPDGYVFRI